MYAGRARARPCALADLAHLASAALTNQFGKYYRDNTWDDCPGMLDSWTRCIKGKLAKKDRAEQLKLEEVRKQRRKFEGVHVFTFREGYRQTAAKLYGVGLPPGDDAAAPGEAQGG